MPSASAGPPADITYCPLSTRVRDVDDTHTRYAVSFRAFETGLASGTVSLWAGDRRYDVPFRNVVALDSRDVVTPETSIVVRFAAPTALDGAVVTAIDKNTGRHPCDPWFGPWVAYRPSGPDRRTAEQRTAEDGFIARARAATPIPAPMPVTDPAPCPTPNQLARTIRPVEPDRPRFAGTGTSTVMVLLDPSDTIVNARIERSSGDRLLDNAALIAARASTFQGQIFRCRHVMGEYLFTVRFN